jgi:DNA-binding response OmpR family regulator
MTETPTGPWIIELSNSQARAPLRLHVTGKITVGRIVANDPSKPDVDLTTFNAEALGVSRLHFTVHPEVDRLVVTDLNSGNGTFLNGNRLKANEMYRISAGDQLTVGLLRLDVSFVVTPDHGGNVQRQPSLQLHDQIKPGKGQLVLIVEQDPDVASALAAIMEGAGYTPKVSQEVVGAIRTYNQRRPSAIILNPSLPDMSGLEFCRYIRRDVNINTTPVIVVNTGVKPLPSSDALQAGADIFLERPISARELRHVISSLITQHESGHSAMYTKHLVGTAPLRAMEPETRKNTCVLFVAAHSDAPIVLTVTQPVSFGRAITSSGLKSHVDLTRYDAANFGVSRVHMRLHYVDGKFQVEDQESVNGTYVNGESVKPHVLTELNNADEIRLGQLRMYIYFLEDADKTDTHDETEQVSEPKADG